MKRTPESSTRKRALIEKPPLAMVVKSGDPAPAAQAESDPSREARTRELAYGLYVARGCVDGHDLDDWLAAEATVAAEYAPAGPATTSH